MAFAGLNFMNFVERRNFIDEKLREKGVEKKPLSADGFLEIWSHYDKDGNYLSVYCCLCSLLVDFENRATWCIHWLLLNFR